MILLYIYIGCVIAFFLAMKFSSTPYPKEWEEEENKELEEKFKKHKEKDQE